MHNIYSDIKNLYNKIDTQYKKINDELNKHKICITTNKLKISKQKNGIFTLSIKGETKRNNKISWYKNKQSSKYDIILFN